MKYYNIKEKLQKLIVFSLKDIYFVDPEFRQATLYDWEKAKKVIKLKNNCYIFNDFLPNGTDFYLLSNLMYDPSYVSTELALNHYGLIPESVLSITAVSTNKTQLFETPVGIFSYQTIRPELYFGYELIEHKNHGVKIANFEKSILDYLYLHSEIISLESFEELRWNKRIILDRLDQKKLTKYEAIFNNQALSQRLELLRQYLRI